MPGPVLLALGSAFGMAAGVLIGVLTGHLVTGIAFGLVAGSALGTTAMVFKTQDKSDRGDTPGSEDES